MKVFNYIFNCEDGLNRFLYFCEKRGIKHDGVNGLAFHAIVSDKQYNEMEEFLTWCKR